MKILQIVWVAGAMVKGLGDDNKIYEWVTRTESWEVYSTKPNKEQ